MTSRLYLSKVIQSCTKTYNVIHTQMLADNNLQTISISNKICLNHNSYAEISVFFTQLKKKL